MAKIMIVDDEPGMVKLVKLILEKDGHTLIEALSGTEALEILKHTKPDLILLDIMMPHLDGWETLKSIREQEAFKEIPVSMLTAKHLTPEVTKRPDIIGLVDYIQKPFTRASLSQRVTEILRDLDNIDKRLYKLRSIIGDESKVDVYKLAAREERLHKSMIATLNEIFESSKDSEQIKDELKSAIKSQQEMIENLIRQRSKIEADTGV